MFGGSDDFNLNPLVSPGFSTRGAWGGGGGGGGGKLNNMSDVYWLTQLCVRFDFFDSDHNGSIKDQLDRLLILKGHNIYILVYRLSSLITLIRIISSSDSFAHS